MDFNKIQDDALDKFEKLHIKENADEDGKNLALMIAGISSDVARIMIEDYHRQINVNYLMIHRKT